MSKRRYTPLPPPAGVDPAVIQWLTFELQRIAQATDQDNLLPVEYVAPEKPVDGQVVLADGTDWNPGSNQGAYVYYAGAWHKLG